MDTMPDLAANSGIDFSDHDVWRLILVVASDSLTSFFYNTESRQMVRYAHTEWMCEHDDILRHIEDAVYENPLILDDYTTTLLLSPDSWSTVPSGLCETDDDGGDITDTMLRHIDLTESHENWVDPTGEQSLIFTTPKGVRSFLMRTFPTNDIHHIMHPFLSHFGDSASRQKSDRMWVDIRSDKLYAAAWSGGKLQFCCVREFRAPIDAAYYIVYAWQTLGLNSTEGEVKICGVSELRQAIMPIVRKYINYVSVAILPAHIKAATSADIPLAVALATTPKTYKK